jgi:hypothetical protein
MPTSSWNSLSTVLLLAPVPWQIRVRGPTVTRIGEKYGGDAERSWIGWIGKLQWNHLDGFQLVDDHEYQMTLRPHCLL